MELQGHDNYKRRVGAIRGMYSIQQEAFESERRKEAILMSDIEKFRLFCKLARIGQMLRNAKLAYIKESAQNRHFPGT